MAYPQYAYDHQECIQHVQRYIRDHLSEPLDRKRLAQISGFSVPHLHRIFTACTQETINGYIRRIRLERAGRKLRMGAVDISDVALSTGYATHAAFSKAFKQQFGVTPSTFRDLGCRARVNFYER